RKLRYGCNLPAHLGSGGGGGADAKSAWAGKEGRMIELRKTYPLYLANEARQPNADLEVTHKYTGEVAFRTALADAATIDAGIAAAAEAACPMARMASYERQAVLQ